MTEKVSQKGVNSLFPVTRQRQYRVKLALNNTEQGMFAEIQFSYYLSITKFSLYAGVVK